MKSKVSVIWRIFGVLLIGVILGIGLAVKYMIPPSTEIRVGNIRIRGRGNRIDEIIDLSDKKRDEWDPADPPQVKKERRRPLRSLLDFIKGRKKDSSDIWHISEKMSQENTKRDKPGR